MTSVDLIAEVLRKETTLSEAEIQKTIRQVVGPNAIAIPDDQVPFAREEMVRMARRLKQLVDSALVVSIPVKVLHTGPPQNYPNN